MRQQKGFALVLVLWVLSLLIVMAGSFSLSMRRQSSVVFGIKSHSQAKAIAESGFTLAQIMLSQTDEEKRWHADGSIYQIHGNETFLRIKIASETGKIDLNQADEALLTALVTQAPISEKEQKSLVDAILDWRDDDDETREHGAEKKEYQRAKLDFFPKNKAFTSVDELQQVLGMNEDVFNFLMPLVTVYSGQAQVNLAQASRAVLEILPNVDSKKIDAYFLAKQQNLLARKEPPPTSMLLNKSDEISSDESSAEDSQVITITTEARFEDDIRVALEITLEKTDNAEGLPFQVLKWREKSLDNEESLFDDNMENLVVADYAEPELID